MHKILKYTIALFNLSWSGRASRTEYIIVTLVNLALFASAIAMVAFDVTWMITIPMFVFVFVQGSAVDSRRNNDIYRKKGIVYWNVSKLAYFTEPSDEGENEYGPEPWDS